MKVVILCGGKGSRFREETEVKPKPMISIGGMPILWHIMKTYAHYGFCEFILCLGYKGDMIKKYFYHYELLSNDFTIELGSNKLEIHPRHRERGWKITLVDTGAASMTGARVKRVQPYVDGEDFMLTYGDGVTDLDLKALLAFHKQHGRIGTVTGVSPPSRYGELSIRNGRVQTFSEKPGASDSCINGGYFVFQRQFFDYLEDDDQCILEREPLERLAVEGQLQVYRHDKFWQCMDTYRDFQFLERLWNAGRSPWKVW